MIDEKKIQEAAEAYTDTLWVSDDCCTASTDGFLSGVRWFRQNLWHDASEIPDVASMPLYKDKTVKDKAGFPLCYCTILTDDMKHITVFSDYLYSDSDWQTHYVIPNGIRRWCYVSDLLQKGGER